METLNKDRLTYESYLKIPELLTLQHVLSNHHDEMLFILIHQIYELWFKEILHELEALMNCFENGNVQTALKVLNRVLAIQRVLVGQIEVLETMTPVEFATFRDNLRPASGFQSVQFREIEFISGLKNPQFLAMFSNLPDARQRLEARMAAPTLYDLFLGMLARKGFAIPQSVLERNVCEPYHADPRVVEAIEQIYKSTPQHYELYMLCESLLSYDENFSLWRYRHVKMVERTIGMKTGTGGSTGVKYLSSILDGRFFPELWEVRSLLGTY